MNQFAAAKSHRINNFRFKSCVTDITCVVSSLKGINY